MLFFLLGAAASTSFHASARQSSHLADFVRQDPEQLSTWRHTALGWERSEHWLVGSPQAPRKPVDRGLHPVVVALLELLLSLAALLSLPPRRRRSPSR